MNQDRDEVYVEHILECIDRIKDYTQHGKDSFMNQSLVQDGVLRRLQIMAESSQRLSDELKASIADVDWRALSGFRNILVHDYLGGIDLERLDAIAHDLPSLEKAMKQMAAQLDRESNN